MTIRCARDALLKLIWEGDDKERIDIVILDRLHESGSSMIPGALIEGIEKRYIRTCGTRIPFHRVMEIRSNGSPAWRRNTLVYGDVIDEDA